MDDAYKKIGSIVEQWCEENMYTTMLVTISIGYEWETPHEETHLLEWDFESWSLVCKDDWWEGQQHVELVGFKPMYKIRLVGADAEVATVRHGRDTQEERYFKCSECGYGAADVYESGPITLYEGTKRGEGGWHYCPNCGAKMDKEDANG